MPEELFREFGWQRFRMEAPERWEPGHFEGDDLKGYVRLDDLRMPRIELKWDEAYREGAVENALKNYTSELLRRTKKGQELRREPKEYDVAEYGPGLEGKAVRWSGDVDGVAAFIGCPTCKRLTALQIIFPGGSLVPSTVKRVLQTFRDHPEEGQPTLWSVYRMRMLAPSDWRLKAHQFGPGFAALGFAGPRRLRAEVREAGPAEVLVEKMKLEDWARRQLPKGVSLVPDAFEKTEVAGDEVLAASRNPQGIVALLQRRSHKDAALRGMPMQTVAWHCPSSNRLWMVTVYAATLEEAREAEWKVACHG